MTARRVGVLVGCVCLLFLVQAPVRVRACGGAPCRPDQMLPASGSLPQNAPGVAVFLGQADFALPDAGGERFMFAFECTDAAGASSDVAFELRETASTCKYPLCERPASLIVPMAPLPVGAMCRITGNACDLRTSPFGTILAGTDHLWSRATFAVTEAASLPATLGAIELEPAAARQPLALPAGAECSLDRNACVMRARLVLSAEAEPWRDALIYSTFVDGQRWTVHQTVNLPDQQGGSYLGRGNELFYYLIGDRGGLSRGMHHVTIEATLAGTALALATAEQAFVLDCGDETDAVGPDAAIDAGASRPPVDGGEPASVRDGGDNDGEPAAGNVDEDEEDEPRGASSRPGRATEARAVSPDGDGGCAVRHAGGSARAWPALGSALAFALLRRKRRRRWWSA